jgi:Domain of unknown function (DUF6456)
MTRRKPYLSLVSADNRVAEANRPFNAKTGSRVVENPYFNPSDPISKQWITVTTNRRDSPLDAMHRRGLAPHLHKAAEEFQQIFEAREISGPKSVDTSRTPVDGGKSPISDRFSDRHLSAANKIADVRRHLGNTAFGVLQLVLGDRMFLQDVDRNYGWSPRTASRRFRAALEQLAQLWGYAGQAPARRKQCDEYSAMARNAFKVAA